MEKPNSNPNTANSDSELLHTVYCAWLGEMLHRGLGGGGGEEEGERLLNTCARCIRRRYGYMYMSYTLLTTSSPPHHSPLPSHNLLTTLPSSQPPLSFSLHVPSPPHHPLLPTTLPSSLPSPPHYPLLPTTLLFSPPSPPHHSPLLTTLPSSPTSPPHHSPLFPSPILLLVHLLVVDDVVSM